MQPRPIAAALLGLLVLTAAACGGGDAGAGPDVLQETPAPTRPNPDTVPMAGLRGELQQLLLTPNQVGDDVVPDEAVPVEGAGLCDVDVDAEHPWDESVGTVLVDPTRRLEVRHELRLYADERAATEARTATQEAVGCFARTIVQEGGTDEGTGEVEVGVDAPVDLSAVTETPTFMLATPLADDGATVVLTVAQVGRLLTVYELHGQEGRAGDPAADTIAMDVVMGSIEQVRSQFDG